MLFDISIVCQLFMLCFLQLAFLVGCVFCQFFWLFESVCQAFCMDLTDCLVGLVFCGEFDPGSGRTLAACLTHASRTMKLQLAVVD